MRHQSPFHSACTFCGCNNPLFEMLKSGIAEHLSLPIPENVAVVNPAAAPTIFTGGTIRPMIKGDVSPVEALGIANGLVVKQGTLTQVNAWFDEQGITPNVVTLAAHQVLLPGLIEPHVHIVPTALLTGSSCIDVGPFSGQDLVPGYNLDYVQQKIEAALPTLNGDWALGLGVDPALMPFISAPVGGLAELTPINAGVLDRISSAIPIIMLSASMHTVYANTPALVAIFQNPRNAGYMEAHAYTSAQAFIDATQGQLEEAAAQATAFKTLPLKQWVSMILQLPEQIKAMFATAHSLGVTMLYDAAMDSISSLVLQGVMALSAPTMRVGAAKVIQNQASAESLDSYVQAEQYHNVYYGHVKVVSDGSNQGITGYQYQAYCCRPASNYGIFNFGVNDTDTKPSEQAPAEFKTLINTVVSQGWPLMIHANGDAAITYTVATLADALTNDPKAALSRNRIEHCSLLSSRNLDLMQQYGISPSFLIGHVGYWGYVFQQAIFPSSVERLDVCQSAHSSNLRLTLHSDHAVTPLGPLRMMEQAITRIMEGAPDPAASFAVLTPTECLTAEQALSAVTYDAAWQCYAENWFGSLEEGHFADMVILQQDPLTMGSASASNYQNYYKKMRNIPVYQTWVGGAVVYQQGYQLKV